MAQVHAGVWRGCLESAETNVAPGLTEPSFVAQEVSAVLGPAAARLRHPGCAEQGHPPLGPTYRAGHCPWQPSTKTLSFLTRERTAALWHRWVCTGTGWGFWQLCIKAQPIPFLPVWIMSMGLFGGVGCKLL